MRSTRLATSLLNEARDRGTRRARFVDMKHFMRLVLQGIDDPVMKAEANCLEQACIDADPLVLDDVGGAEKGSDFSRGVLLTLYERRINAGARTIWTSNLDYTALATFLGDDRLLSRIAGQAGEAIELAGDDARLVARRPGGRRKRGALAVVRRRQGTS